MIARIGGTLIARELDRVEVMTAGGVGYSLAITLGVYETLPKVGEPVTLHTSLVVREDEWLLFGFASAFERSVFEYVLAAKGVGPSLALSMLSTLTARRLVRAIRERDVATLQSVPRVGRKKAEQLILDLADKLEVLEGEAEVAGTHAGETEREPGAEDAIRALVSLGYASADAERAVRGALDDRNGGTARSIPAPELIRAALARVGAR
ncbi:MAG: Holliday junction branch migration protein RuvA [Gemmatimonadaceae bacterium]